MFFQRGGKDKRFDICSTTTTFCKPTEVCLVVSVGHDGSFTVSQVFPVSSCCFLFCQIECERLGYAIIENGLLCCISSLIKVSVPA